MTVNSETQKGKIWEKESFVVIILFLLLFIYLFIYSKVQKSGIWLGLVKFERPTDIFIEMLKSHWDLGWGRNLDCRYLFGFCKHNDSFKALRLPKIIKALDLDRETRRDTKLSPGAFSHQELKLGRGISKEGLAGGASEVQRKPREWDVLDVK